MPGDPRLRAADEDRDRAAALLREHHAAGRLTAEEFHERMEKAMDARTMGELDELMGDLPAIDLYQLPAAGLRPAPPRAQSLVPRDAGETELAGLSAGATALIAWATVATGLVAIGLVTAVLIGAVSAWAFAGLVAAAIGWVVFLIRRAGR